jgi:hypothetical protein
MGRAGPARSGRGGGGAVRAAPARRPWRRRGPAGTLVTMLTLIRLSLQVVLFFLLLSVVVGIAAGETGAAEKVVLAGLGGALLWLASRVRRIGIPSGPRRA